MCILTYVSTLAVSLFTLWFPVPCSAQIAVPLTTSLPLEVRSPYLNFWTHPSNTRDNTTTSAEVFAKAVRHLSGRTALLRIDGVTHSILGQLALAHRSNVTGSYITPTRTIFTLDVGPVEVSVTFLSPIEPYDRVRQSIPFTYISFDLNVTDGKTHLIELYAHVQSESFFDTDSVQNVTWSTASTFQSVFQTVQLQNQISLTENAHGQAEWGQLYFATARSNAVTFGVGSADSLIRTFSNRGSLYNVPVAGSEEEGLSNTTTAFAFSRNLGAITHDSSAVFAFGFIQDPAVQSIDPKGQTQNRVPFFRTKYLSITDVIDDFIGDYTAASLRSLLLDDKVFNDTTRYPHDHYPTLLSLVTRLVFASTVLTVGETPEGVVNSTDAMMFMKNIGGASATNRVNPVEVMYAAFPMFLYFDSSLGGLLLEPLLRYQAWPNVNPQYTARDAGTSYPNTSIPETHDQGIEQTANMLLMIYAHARMSGDVTLIQNHISRMKNWTEFLVGSTLYTAQQETANLLSISNQTNLAIKGIIAIKAMSVMIEVAGQSADYSAIADAYYAQWKSQALGSDNHLLVQYGHESSWSLGENMFADMWLQTGLIGRDIFAAQVNFLKTVNTTGESHTFTVAETGIPLDSLRINNVTYSSNMFAAGFADTELRRTIMSGMIGHPLAEDLAVVNNKLTTWSQSPYLGSAYAPLILNVPLLNITHNMSIAQHGFPQAVNSASHSVPSSPLASSSGYSSALSNSPPSSPSPGPRAVVETTPEPKEVVFGPPKSSQVPQQQ
ncbi:hypothetical protein BGY98DRAFT_1076449 [Russula aff. rugulosa BPL654]|nr:hypothetical protein BGY98DRAFT_1076449 [Russula aff. rugulosa BPL654]